MRKGFFLLPGIVALVALAFMPAASFAATSTRTAGYHPNNLLSQQVQQSRGAAQAASSVSYHNGPVMGGTMNIYAIFWEPSGNVSANYNSLIKRYFGDVGGSSLYQNNQQYSGQGTAPSDSKLAGTWIDSASYPENPLLDSDIQGEVSRAQSVNGWSSSINNAFFVFTEKNENICMDSTDALCTSNTPETFCGYHNYFGTNTIYAAIPYAASFFCNPGSSPNNDDADQTINVTSREQMDTATDPLLNAWYDSSGNEIGDKCSWTFGASNSLGADATWNSNAYIVPDEWSNAFGSCTSGSAPVTYYKIVNRNSGLELDVMGGGTNAGANVIQYTDHNGANQMWDLVPDGNYYRIVNLNSGLELDVMGGGTNAGANVIQYTNHEGLNQQWSLVPDGNYDRIVNHNSGLELDVDHGDATAGEQVIQYINHEGLNQQWSLVPVTTVYYRIVNRNSGLEMDVKGGGTNAGAQVIQYTNHNGLNQQWNLVPDGNYYQIVNHNSGLCLDVSGSSTTGGAKVIQQTSQGSTSQEWSLVPDGGYYRIVNLNSGLELDVDGGGKNAGANIIQWPNHEGLNQQWKLVAVP